MTDKPLTEKPEHDFEPLYEGPAVFANRCFVSVSSVVRLTFMEQQPTASPNAPSGPLHFRSAIALDLAQAVAFSKILQNLLSDVERQIKEHEADLVKDDLAERAGKNA